jgi:hypothetical protein
MNKRRARNRVSLQYLVYSPDYTPFQSALHRYRTKARAFRKARALGDGSTVMRSVERWAYARDGRRLGGHFTNSHVWDLWGGFFYEDQRVKRDRKRRG